MKRVQFSKVMIAGIVSIYFLAALVVFYVVLFMDCSQVGVLCTFIGTQTTPAVAFYIWKAKSENVLKIKGSDKYGYNTYNRCIDPSINSHGDNISNTDFEK